MGEFIAGFLCLVVGVIGAFALLVAANAAIGLMVVVTLLYLGVGSLLSGAFSYRYKDVWVMWPLLVGIPMELFSLIGLLAGGKQSSPFLSLFFGVTAVLIPLAFFKSAQIGKERKEKELFHAEFPDAHWGN